MSSLDILYFLVDVASVWSSEDSKEQTQEVWETMKR